MLSKCQTRSDIESRGDPKLLITTRSNFRRSRTQPEILKVQIHEVVVDYWYKVVLRVLEPPDLPNLVFKRDFATHIDVLISVILKL